MRTVSLTDTSHQPQHRAATTGLQWDALSDDDEAVGAAAMDGYTSSDDSYGGHMGGFAFEGAVSEADSYDEEHVRCTSSVTLPFQVCCLECDAVNHSVIWSFTCVFATT